MIQEDFMKLFLCEKPSQARDIGAVIGATQRKDGYLSSTDNQTLVTWAVGHLLQQYNPEDYSEDWKKWEMATLPIIPNQWLMKPTDNAKKQYSVVSGLIKQAAEVVIATDADREGEVIGVELLEINNYRGKRSRLWLSALDEKSIKKALDDIRDAADTYPLYEAGLGRQRADWLYGMSVTRGLTIANRGRVDGVLNAGRVQTPTLKLVVDRDHEIENFKPTDYFDVETIFDTVEGAYRGKLIPTDDMLVDDYLVDRTIAQRVVDIIENTPEGKVVEYKKENKKTAAPLGYSLSQLQKECSSLFGYSATQTLEIAQALYEEHKATTYPRSDCRFLPTEQESEINAVISAIFSNNSENKTLKDVQSRLDLDRRNPIWNTNKVTAHHAIIPTTASFSVAKLSEEELNVYSLIRNNFLMQFLEDYEYKSVYIKTNVADKYDFESKGNTPTVTGWKDLVVKAKAKAEKPKGNDKSPELELPPLSNGYVVGVDSSSIKPKQTKPRPRFTEGTLIDAMKNIAKYVTNPELKKVLRETSGIGTEATRANIIQKLFETGYLEKEGKKKIKSTEKGRSMISIAPDLLKNPETTSLWEQGLEDVSTNKKTLTSFMDTQARTLTKIVEEIKSGRATLKTSVSGHSCKSCGSPLIRRKGGNGFFWGCSNYPTCSQTYPDAKGKPQYEAKAKAPAKTTGAKCPKCGSDIVERQGKNGVFYACSGFPKCKETFYKEGEEYKLSSERPKQEVKGEPCTCGKGVFVLRKGKNGNFFGCSNFRGGCRETRQADENDQIKL